MHHIYHTEGIILGSRNYGEAGKCFYVFTRDLGMIYASAQGIRKISSKLRFVLQDFTYVKLDLVRGKDFWRITSASKTNMLEGIARDSSKLQIMVNVSKLLRRLLAGEDPNSILFQDLILGLEILDKNTEKFELPNVEVILVLRILNNLGYIGGQENIKNLIQSPFENDLVYEVAKKKKDILIEINKALKETQL
jgi:DNA repair protein RecO (recombination protein O)